MVHGIVGIADRQGSERVSVKTAFDGKEFTLGRFAFSIEVLQCHFHTDIDGNRSRVSQHHAFQGVRKHLDKLFTEFNSGFMHNPAEHDVGHGFELVHCGSVEPRVVISVLNTPPACHAIHYFPPIL